MPSQESISKEKRIAILPFNSTIIKDKYLVSNMLGGWDFLSKEEFRLLHSFNIKNNHTLLERLYEKGLAVDENSFKKLIGDYRNLNAHLFRDTSLHIAVVTTRCNLRCAYCQTKSAQTKDMTQDVARRVLKYIFDMRNHCITLEFQGGEPLLNWEILSFLIEYARRFNVIGKQLSLSLVSNLTLLDEDKIQFLKKFNVGICASLDGPRQIHDRNRVFANGKGTYEVVAKNIEKLKVGLGRKVNLLPTITRQSLGHFKEIIDEYVKWGEEEISLRPVNRIGTACGNWLSLGYSTDEFNEFYRKSMDYILELNKSGVVIRERMAKIMLEKIINKKDPGYVDLMNPCGTGRATIAYMPDGSCYPCDEARMVGGEMFKLGNILQEDYQDLVKKDNFLHLLESSLINLWDYKSAFFPWTGTCPVVNYILQGNIVPKIKCSSVHRIYESQFRYIFEKILESSENLAIFKNWVNKTEEK